MHSSFRTELDPKDFPHKLAHSDGIVSVGSCFADHLSSKLQYYKFKVCARPYGVIYSPLVIAHNLRNTIAGVSFDERYLVQQNGLWHSFIHHGSFSAPDKNELLKRISESEKNLKQSLKSAKLLILTFGSSYTYFYKKEAFAVANCHKISAREFERILISHERSFAELNILIQDLEAFNPKLKILLSVSPVRHLKDGFHQNQLSKAHLLLACDQLVQAHDEVYYFPAYELLMDDLRDYRFYASDMLHPNDSAINYIWEKWVKAFISEKSKSLLKEIDAIQKGIAHRPLHSLPESEKAFAKKLLQKIDQLKEKIPELDFEKESEKLLQR
ncbi:MAG: GSCFA domain-containing protein [Chitinophagales bacterium]